MRYRERWRPIRGYTGVYEVSNRGNVRSLNRRTKDSMGIFRKFVGQTLIPNEDRYGYFYVSIASLGKYKSKKIHRLVAEAFKRNPHNKPQVNHLDGNKQNNNDWNLEWSTEKENDDHARLAGLKSIKGILHHKAKLTEKQVLKIRELYAKGKSVKELVLKFKVKDPTIRDILKRRNWSHI